MMERQKIAVLGAGAWGTALAIHLARVGHDVQLWSHNPEVVKQMQATRQNQRYLSGVKFPETLQVNDNFYQVCLEVDAILVVVPSHAFRQTLEKISQIHNETLPKLAWATKGFEPKTGAMLHQVAEDVFGREGDFAVLSGPTFADEVARGLPTAMVSASPNAGLAQYWADVFQSEVFRLYTQTDMVGVELGGAYKNIMAIATGLSDGLQLGANARAALVSRGLVEMNRFAQSMGADPKAMMGLAGLGDLVLTCTDNLSRNRRFGLMLAQSGRTPEEVIEEIGQVVEGVKAVKAVKKIAEEKGLDLPIMEQVYAIVTGQINPKEAVKLLMARDARAES